MHLSYWLTRHRQNRSESLLLRPLSFCVPTKKMNLTIESNRIRLTIVLLKFWNDRILPSGLYYTGKGALSPKRTK
jgi:hypothetical protein